MAGLAHPVLAAAVNARINARRPGPAWLGYHAEDHTLMMGYPRNVSGRGSKIGMGPSVWL